MTLERISLHRGLESQNPAIIYERTKVMFAVNIYIKVYCESFTASQTYMTVSVVHHILILFLFFVTKKYLAFKYCDYFTFYCESNIK